MSEVTTAPVDSVRQAVTWLLRIGMAVPFVYFGIPVVAAPFYPDYSFIRNTASDLGSNQAVYPEPVNAAIIVLGMLTLLAAVGFFWALPQLRVHPVLRWIAAIAVASNGLATLLSGVFPSPDPRHGGGFLGIGTFLLPFVFAIIFWQQPGARIAKWYFAANILLFLAMIPVMSGMLGLDLASVRGLTQRILAFTAFAPIGVSAFLLLQRVNHH